MANALAEATIAYLGDLEDERAKVKRTKSPHKQTKTHEKFESLRTTCKNKKF